MSFDADAAFLAFLQASEQKPMEAELLNTLIADLAAEEGLLGSGEGPLRVLFPGIGEGLQAAELAADIFGTTGRQIHIHGIEASQTFGDTARDRLSADPNVASVEIEIGDAFSPGNVSSSGMDLAIGSHLLYYAPSDAAVVALVTALVEGLDSGGVALLLHEPPPPSNVATLRGRYGGDTVIPSPVPLVDAAAADAGVPVSRVEFRSRFRFPRVEIPEVLDSVDARGGAEADEARKLIEFALTRGLGDLRKEGVLDEALEDFFARLDPETNELKWKIQLQVLPSKELAADAARVSSLESSVERIRARIPGLEARYLRV